MIHEDLDLCSRIWEDQNGVFMNHIRQYFWKRSMEVLEEDIRDLELQHLRGIVRCYVCVKRFIDLRGLASTGIGLIMLLIGINSFLCCF